MLSVILPTHCEAGVVEETLRRVSESLHRLNHEIVVVDDASTDDTGRLVESFARTNGAVRLIRKSDKQGTARAIQTGVECSRGEVIATMNADLQHPPAMLPAMLEGIQRGCDVVVGSRYVARGNPGMSPFRVLVSKSAILLTRLLFPRARAIRDPLAGYFMFKRAVVSGIQVLPCGSNGHVSIGLKFLLGMLVLGSGADVCELPCHMQRRQTGRSKFSPWDIAAFSRYLVFLFRRSGEAARVATFCTVGASAFLIYEGVLCLLTEALGVPYPFSAAVGWALAFLWSFHLNDRFTFGAVRRQHWSSAASKGTRYLVVKLVGLALHLLILTVLTELAGIHYALSAGLAVLVVVAWNYVASRDLVWGRSGLGRAPAAAWRARADGGV